MSRDITDKPNRYLICFISPSQLAVVIPSYRHAIGCSHTEELVPFNGLISDVCYPILPWADLRCELRPLSQPAPGEPSLQ